MNYEIVTLSEKTFVGIQARTDNNDPQMPAIIGGMWQRFMGEGIWQSIKNPANTHCVGLYSNYGETSYDVTIGAEVTANGNPELTAVTIPTGKYAKFFVRGDVVKDVSDAWTEIWSMPLERSFTGDFEEYVSNVDGVAEVEIYVALK